MILFAAGRGEARKRFLVGVGSRRALPEEHRRALLGGGRDGEEEGDGIVTDNCQLPEVAFELSELKTTAGQNDAGPVKAS